MQLKRAFESSTVSLVLNKLATQQVLDYLLKWNIDQGLLQKMKMSLLEINAVLDHAEEKQYKDPNVQAWLQEVRAAAYDAEDMMDEIATDALQSHLSRNTAWSFACDYLDVSESIKEGMDYKMKDVVSALNPFDERPETKMAKIVERLEYIAKQKGVLNLQDDEGKSNMISEKLETAPMLNHFQVYGRAYDAEKIMEMLLAGQPDDKQIHVIPIVGIGGVGKTTLAQIVYGQEIIKEHFDLKAWACVSDKFNVKGITKTLIESLSKDTCRLTSLELLQESLQKKLCKKKFLLVLDDIWNENYSDWETLQLPFTEGAPGSRIIVTTRSENVAQIMGTFPAYHLKELSKDDCWLMVEQIAFPGRNYDAYPNLRPIGKKIAEKCKGLPLAAKVLGGLLRGKLDEKEWKDILCSSIWDLDDGNNILPALRLSYYHLPGHLKQCFAYCSLFPKDYEFEKQMLVLLWMAEGLVESSKDETETMEEIGSKYLSCLVSRSFFQHLADDKSRYMMHDLIHDLSQLVSANTCFRLESKIDGHRHQNILSTTRRFSYIREFNDSLQKFEPLNKCKSLRTILPLNPKIGFLLSDLPKTVCDDLLPKVRFLRVLSLSGYCICKLADSIGDLRHLRYLNLSHNKLEHLPESIGNLYNLQTLILLECHYLRTLITNIGSLTNLRHLKTSKTQLQKMPMKIGRLTRLQTLSDFVIGTNNDSGIKELKVLSDLRGRLSISGLDNVVNVWDAVDANLWEKKHLEELVLEWSRNFNDARDERVETEVLDGLQPHQNLKSLEIKFYGGIYFPNWMGDSSFEKIVYLHLHSPRKCESLPALGQLPSLKDLVIEGMNVLKEVGHEFYYGDDVSPIKPFQKLETLKFENMEKWEEWYSCGDDEVEAFSCLRELSIFRCPNLNKFSHKFPSLERLMIKKCEVITSFSSQYDEFPHLQSLNIVACPKLILLPDSLPSLEGLELDGCSELSALPRLANLRRLSIFDSNAELLGCIVHLSSLTVLHISDISCIKSLPEGFMQKSMGLENLKIDACSDLEVLSNKQVGLMHLASLKRLTFSHCPKLVSIPDEVQMLRNLEILDFKHCHNLVKLPINLCKLISLAELKVENCSRLQTFPEMGLPPTLRRLLIRHCEALRSSQNVFQNNNSLEYLEIHQCSFLTLFVCQDSLPTTLKILKICYCRHLTSIPEEIMRQGDINLENLDIDNCPSLKSFPPGRFPATLRSLDISNCINLHALPESLLNLVNLDSFAIHRCTQLEHFPRGGLPANLRSFKISECEKLKFLPERMHTMKRLRELMISGCSNLESLPRQGFPSNLTLLLVRNNEKLSCIQEWRLHKLTSLEKLSIGGIPGMTSFSNIYLPNSIVSLQIIDLPDVISLPKGLKNLSSLQTLAIRECEKLCSFPEEGLPSSIGELTVRNCPLLRTKCEADTRLMNIPFIELS